MSFTGVIKSFGAQKGYGFIGSDQLSSDAFFGRKALPVELKDGLVRFDLIGKSVRFELEDQFDDGKPVAKNLRLEATVGEQCVGQVKSYNESKGYGFIGSSSLEGQDCFFGSRDVPRMASVYKGAFATFVVHQSDDGKLQAKSLVFSDGPPGSSMPSMPPWELAATYQGLYFGMPQSKVAEGQGMQGIVLSFNPVKGFGFIRCAKAGGDVYFKDNTGNLLEGAPVCFTLKIMPDGKLQARDVSPGLAANETYSGTISSYSARHGWGFIAVDDYPAEVHFKSQTIASEGFGEELKGISVRVTIKLTEDGLPQASSVELLGGARPVKTGAKRAASGHPGPILPPKKMKGSGGGSADAMTGTVLSYNPVKGFGFIQSPAVEGDIFLGRKALQMSGAPADDSVQGRDVSFHLVTSPQGKLQAENIQVF